MSNNPGGRFADLVLDYARDTAISSDGEVTNIPNIIDYIESPWGLKLRLFPVQKFILKMYYKIPLDETNRTIEVTDKFREKVLYTFTEKEYLGFLWNESRINVKEQDDKIRNELVLVIGRRGSKTAMSSFIASYELYKLLLLNDPHAYYGIPEYNRIGITSVATDKDQAGLLFHEVSGHLSTCDLFSPYKESDTQSLIRLWTPSHLKRYGPVASPKLFVTFKACVAKGLRGPGNIVLILDEFAHFSGVGQASAENVYKAITPSTSTFSRKDPNNPQIPLNPYSDGRVVAISSPLDDTGMFHELFETAMSGNPASESMLCIQAPSWEVNCTIPNQELKQKYYKNPEDFMVEYGAQFSGRSTKYIERRADLEACIVPNLKPSARGLPRRQHWMGIDVGITDDGTAITIVHREDDYIVEDFHAVRYAGVGDYQAVERLDIENDIVNWIYELSQSFLIEEGTFDQWHGIGLEQFLVKKGIYQFKSVHVGAELNSQMYRNFLTLMYTKRLRLFDYPIAKDAPTGAHCPLITELLSLKKERSSKNIISVAAPKVAGHHDDASDSLIRAVWLASADFREVGDIKRAAKDKPGSQVHRSANLPSAEAMYRSYHRKRETLHGAAPRSRAPQRSVRGY